MCAKRASRVVVTRSSCGSELTRCFLIILQPGETCRELCSISQCASSGMVLGRVISNCRFFLPLTLFSLLKRVTERVGPERILRYRIQGFSIYLVTRRFSVQKKLTSFDGKKVGTPVYVCVCRYWIFVRLKNLAGSKVNGNLCYEYYLMVTAGFSKSLQSVTRIIVKSLTKFCELFYIHSNIALLFLNQKALELL